MYVVNIRSNKTRISIWRPNNLNSGSSGRFAKIELNKFTITNGFSNKNTHLWRVYSFTNIKECIILLKTFINNINITLDTGSILEFYSKLK